MQLEQELGSFIGTGHWSKKLLWTDGGMYLADQVIIGDKIFTDIVDSSFEISHGTLNKAHVESS